MSLKSETEESEKDEKQWKAICESRRITERQRTATPAKRDVGSRAQF